MPGDASRLLVGQGTRPSAELFWNYSSSIKIFHLGTGPRTSVLASGLVPMPPEADVPGFLAQAARMLLGVSQAWLWDKSGVSRKTINDFENGYRQPKTALRSAIRAELERAGAHFVFGEEAIGVVVYEANGADEPTGAGASIGVNANGSS